MVGTRRGHEHRATSLKHDVAGVDCEPSVAGIALILATDNEEISGARLPEQENAGLLDPCAKGHTRKGPDALAKDGFNVLEFLESGVPVDVPVRVDHAGRYNLCLGHSIGDGQEVPSCGPDQMPVEAVGKMSRKFGARHDIGSKIQGDQHTRIS